MQFSRRSLIGSALGTAATIPFIPNIHSHEFVNALLFQSPDNAALAEQQVLRFASDIANQKSLDFYEVNYGRPNPSALFSEPLVRLNRDLEIVPGAAREWTSNEDKTSWTFTLNPDATWSDGTPVTAEDFIYTFRYAADPAHAWDFTWYWSGDIVNFAEAVAGEVAIEEIGVRQGENEFELIFDTISSSPALPAKMLSSQPLSKKAMDEHGAYYNNNPETCVSSGPFVLQEWNRDQNLIYVKNKNYTGDYPVVVEQIVVTFGDPTTFFTLYESNQIDYMEGASPIELELIASDPEKEGELHQSVGDFANLYFFFDVDNAPFDDLRVRQAFSHVLDRDALKQGVWGDQANPAGSMLAPGFPASNAEDLASIQNFDPELARQLLEEAGYPNGEGFPPLILNTRGGAIAIETSTAQAYGSMLKEHLNIDVEIQQIDRQAFYDAMGAKPTTMQFGFVSYGMDYFDASSMLGVWQTGGRHPWSNSDFDETLTQATSFSGSDEERTAMFQEAERILVEDVPAVFAYFYTPIQLIKPHLAGPALEPNNNGFAAITWPGFTTMNTVPQDLYVGNDDD